jgi:SAM-dependent methyltransferase
MSSQQAFDRLAPAYDDTFTHTQIGRYLRQRVHARLNLHFHAGNHVLELGCGTGEDALYLARRGVRVTATDSSERMLAVARAKAAGNPFVSVERLDLRHLANSQQPTANSRFDGIFSNFGALNCLDDWRPLAGWLAERVKPGGIVAFGVMSPLCLWEMGWHGLHLDFKTATRRLRKETTFQPDESSAPISVRYPTIRRLTRDFAPWFRRIHVQGIGLFLPPSDVFGVVEKRPRLLKLLMELEERFARYGKLALLADHYWIEFERTLRDG